MNKLHISTHLFHLLLHKLPVQVCVSHSQQHSNNTTAHTSPLPRPSKLPYKHYSIITIPILKN